MNMEFDDIHSAWKQNDLLIKKKIRMNTELLKTYASEKYSHSLKKSFRLEILNLFFQLIVVGLISRTMPQFLDELPFLLLGLVSLLCSLTSFVFTAIRAYRIRELMEFNTNLVSYQKRFNELRLLIRKFRRVEYVIAGVLGSSFLIYFEKVHRGIDLLANPLQLIYMLVPAILVGYTLGIILNATVYDKGIKDAQNQLSQLVKFESEE